VIAESDVVSLLADLYHSFYFINTSCKQFHAEVQLRSDSHPCKTVSLHENVVDIHDSRADNYIADDVKATETGSTGWKKEQR